MEEVFEEQRIGIFLCTCGKCLEGIIDYDVLSDFANNIEEVKHVEKVDFLCSDASRERMKEAIRENDLDRVVIAACSPRIYHETFRDTVEEAGLNRFMVDMANIREHCGWIHTLDPEGATLKARDQLTMALANIVWMRPSENGVHATVDQSKCSGCGICATVCMNNAVKMVPDPTGRVKQVSKVDPEVCQGCGVCVSSCPIGAMDMEVYSNEQMQAQIDWMCHQFDEESFPRVLVFACNWCSYAAADMAGLMRMQMDPHFRVIRTLCSGRVDPDWIIRALSAGADGVLLMGGEPGHCHFETGNIRTMSRMKLLKMFLKQMGFDDGRFKVEWVDNDQPERFRDVVSAFTDEVKEIGPNPMKTVDEEYTEPARFTGVSFWQKRRGETEARYQVKHPQ